MQQSLATRLYRRSDRHDFWRLLTEIGQPWTTSARRLDQQLYAVKNRGGQIWLLSSNDNLVGYALVDPIPGLDDIYDLQGGIAKKFRRQGLATQLLAQLITDLGRSNSGLISHPVQSLESEAGRFLVSQGFFIEHEEVKLLHSDLEKITPAPLPQGFTVATFTLPLAASTFRQLYDLAFSGTAWFQPYQSDEEVIHELENAEDLRFLLNAGRPVGFAWLRWLSITETEVEPFGLIPDYQHRSLGQPFLEQVMRDAQQDGAKFVNISAWQENVPALSLYSRIGFQKKATTTYLAYHIKAKSHISQQTNSL